MLELSNQKRSEAMDLKNSGKFKYHKYFIKSSL